MVFYMCLTFNYSEAGSPCLRNTKTACDRCS